MVSKNTRHGSIEFKGQKFDLTTDPEPGRSGFGDVEEGEQYWHEWIARGVDAETGETVRISWEFLKTKGQECSDLDHDWDEVDSVTYL